MDAMAHALLSHAKPRMPLALRTLYVASRNPTPTPLEFAQLFMEITLLDRSTDAGKTAFAACKAAHKKHDPSFRFNALSDADRKRYKAICYGNACPVCGAGVGVEQTFCGQKCESAACKGCNGPMETREVEREVYDAQRGVELMILASILRAKGVTEPLKFREQLEKYHAGCRGKVACFEACDECQDVYGKWCQQHEDFQTFAKEPECFWEAKERRLAALQGMSERKTIVELKRLCVARCCEGSRAKRKRD